MKIGDIQKYLNECLDELRRSIVRQSSALDKSIIKGSRWVLLKNQENHACQRPKTLRTTAQAELRYTNAIAEGINNKIKVLKRMAYGYRDKEYFKLKIYRKCSYLKGATI